jgi:chloramphenicol-sensitive protein RarD
MTDLSDPNDERKQTRIGLAYGIAAYSWWGLVAVYFKAVAHVPAFEILAHRIIWSVLLLSALLRFRGRWNVALAALRERRIVVTLIATTALIAANWFTFIWAIANEQVLQASLGYFINPLVNVLFGFVFLRERLRGWQKVSVALAGTGVSYLTISAGALPLVSLTLAFSFAFYGLLRKTARVDALVGLTLETVLLAPLALGYAVYLFWSGIGAFGLESRATDLLLAAGGVVTAVPLLWFANAVRRLRLATVGFLQYIAPTGQFLLALYFGEDLSMAHLVSFSCIWTALLIYTVDSLRVARRSK